MSEPQQISRSRRVRELPKYYSRGLALAASLLTLSAINYSVDTIGFSNSQALDQFINQFGYGPVGARYLPAWWTSLFNSLIFIGFAIGVWVGSYISNTYGRRMSMFCYNIWALIAAAVVLSSSSRWQIMVARILMYVYVGCELSTIPTFTGEIHPGPIRGFALGTYQFSLNIGAFIVTLIVRGSSTLPGNAAWRVPLGLFCVVPSIVASLIWFIPESPRWCLMKGRREDALRNLRRLRKQGDEDALLTELAEMEARLAADQVGKNSRFRDLWRGVNRRRTLCTIGSSFFLQGTGQSFGSLYGTLFYKSLGTVDPFDLNIAGSFSGIVSVTVYMLFNDKFGRRTLIMMGATIQGSCLLIMASLGSAPVLTQSIKGGIVAFQIFTGFGFSLGWAPGSYALLSELPSQYLRDKTQRIASSVNILTNFTVSFSLAYALHSLGPRVGFIYAPVCYISVLFVYFFIPELKGLSLDQADLLFALGIPARKSASWIPPPIEGVQERKGVFEALDEEAKIAPQASIEMVERVNRE